MLRRLLIVILASLASWITSAQCIKASLPATGHCIGDTLFLLTSDSVSEIRWLKDNFVVETVTTQDTAHTIKVVAGGNGAGHSASQLNQARTIFVDKTGNLFINDYLNNRIQKWAPSSNSGITSIQSIHQTASLGNISPHATDFYVDDFGNIYLSPTGSKAGGSTVVKYAPGVSSGNIVAGGNGSGADPNQLTDPTGIILDREGYLYVAEGFRSRVAQFSYY